MRVHELMALLAMQDPNAEVWVPDRPAVDVLTGVEQEIGEGVELVLDRLGDTVRREDAVNAVLIDSIGYAARKRREKAAPFPRVESQEWH